MPCTEAQRVAKGALFRLGYSPDEVVPPQVGAPGRVVGHRETGWALSDPQPGEQYTAIVTITCSNQGAEFAAQTDEPFPGSAKFKSEFPDAVRKLAAQASDAAVDRQAAGDGAADQCRAAAPGRCRRRSSAAI